jgi:fibronectin type 3 domain-containing protein
VTRPPRSLRIQRRTARAALALLCLALGLGCAAALDVERARDVLAREKPPEAPVLSEAPPARIGAVEGLRTLSGELRAIPLRWDPLLAGDVGGYAVERATSVDGPYERIATVMGRFQTAYTDQGTDLGAKLNARETAGDLGDGNTYYYRVRPFDSRGHLGAQVSPPLPGTTAARPTPPTGLRAYSQLPRQVALSWEPSPDPTVSGYVLSRSPSANGNFLPIATLKGRFATTWVDRGLGDLRVFYYRLSAVNGAGGASDPTPAARAVTKPEPLPPVAVHLAERALGRNVVAWERNVERDLAGYRVLRRRENGAQDELVAEVSAETFRVSDDAVGAGEKVAYTVLAFDRDGLESEPSDPVEGESVGYGLSADAQGSTVTLRWNEAVQAQLASVRVLVDGAFGDVELARVEAPGFVHRGVEPGSTLRYRLVGVRADGREAPPSPVLEVKVPD